jgi:ATP-dependent DNA helicase RecG
MNLSTPIEKLPYVGKIYQKRLKKLGIKNIRDLLYYFPHRYEDFSNVIDISNVKINQFCSIRGKILAIENTRTWKKRMNITNAIVEDNTGAIKVTWFNQPYLTKNLKPDDNVSLAGKVTTGKNGVYMSSPAYEKIIKGRGLTHTGKLIPVYPETKGVSSRWLRFLIKPVLFKVKNSIEEPLPQEIIKEENLLPISKAIEQIHFPQSEELAKKAKERFSFQNLFLIELFVLRQKMKMESMKSFPIPLQLKKLQKLTGSLPFKLTDPQKKSAWQILKDIEKPNPMNRLLEGDVGSGKTVVATIAILNVIKNGYQAALMAPTEILAKQHFKTVWELIKNFKLNVGLLTGKEDKFFSRKLKNDSIEISRKKLLEKVLEGEIDLLIGTHTLIQDKVKFGKLALAIVDEQHRFGVEQRAKLVKGNGEKVIPHVLSMTATPIPRTLALTIYGDLDLSLIDELPKGRKKIITKVVPPKEREKTYQFIKKEIKKGRQVFIICPRIEAKESEITEIKAVKEEHKRLSEKVFKDFDVAMLHGKMTSKEKERIMRDFKNKKTDILVSTSVIEVGIDVPSATIMMIEGADRFGLAQLHQFRGRVGRSKTQSYCFLLTESPSLKTKQRMKALVDCNDGFKLAEKDLKFRGPGDFVGVRQWGIPDLAMESLKDIKEIERTRTRAKEMLKKDPLLKKFPLLRKEVSKMGEKIYLG